MTWLEGWGKRRKLIIDGSKVTEGLANYPLCFLISSGTGMNNTDLSDVFTELAYSVDDDFTGTDGSAPDTAKWKYEGNSTNAKIYSNKLRLWCTAGSSQDVNPTALYELSGDFDIQVDYDLTTYPNTTNWYLGVQCIVDGSNYIVIYRAYTGAQQYRCSTNVAGSLGTDTSTTSDTSGKLRLTRVGTTATGYYWNGSSWTVLRSVSGFSTASIPLRLRLINESSNPACEGNFDNLTVSGSVDWLNYAHPNSKKIAITDIYNNQCYVEIEKFNESLKSACLWIRVPAIEVSSDTELYFYYDKDHADNLSYVGIIGDTVSRNVWDDNYVAVYHLAQKPVTGSKTVFDSSKYLNNLQPNNSEVSDLIVGMCGRAILFDGGEYLEATDANSLDITTTSTLEALIYPTAAELVDEVICKAPNDAGGYQFRGDSGQPAMYFGGSSAGEGTLWTSRWSYYAGTNNVSGQVRYFRDGQLVSSGTGGTTPANTNTLRIGARWDSYYFNGTMDEIRISNIDRSPAYCTLNYYNMWDNLLTISGVEDDPPPPEPEPTWLEGWSKRIKLTVDGTKVSDNLSNFPLLVVLSSGTGKTNADVTDVFDELTPSGVILEDEFSGSVLNVVKWGTNIAPNASVTVSNALELNNATGSAHSGSQCYTQNNFPKIGLIQLSCKWLASISDHYNAGPGPYIRFYNPSSTRDTTYYGCIQQNFCSVLLSQGGAFTTQRTSLRISDQGSAADTSGSIRATIAIDIDESQWHDLVITIDCVTRYLYVDLDNGAYTGSAQIDVTSWAAIGDYFKIEFGTSEYNKTNTEKFKDVVLTGYPNYSKKIALTTSNHNQCFVEIESWNSYSKTAYLWVKAPVLGAGVDTEFYLYYDYSQSDNTTCVGLTGEGVARNVWDSNHTGVWHFNTVPVAGSYTMLDSTGQINNGSPGSSVALADTVYGKAYDFSSSTSSYVSITDDASLDFSSAMTLMVFYILDTFPGGSFSIVSKDVQAGNDYAYGLYCNPGGATYSWADSDGSWGPTWTANDGTAPSVGQWCLNTVTFNGSVLKQYNNGFYVASSSSTTGTIRSNAAAVRFGYTTGWTYILDGKISEARVSNVVRSDGWIKATYYTIVNDLLSFGATEDEARWRFSGTVAAKGSPVERLVLAYRRDTGELVGSATSVSGTGVFDLYTTYSGEHYVLCLDDSEGDVYNALVYDYVIPTTVS